jgi:hypothetical protein
MKTLEQTTKTYTFDPAYRGYHAVYRERETNYCPGCGRTHWWLGRMSAECSFCATALPFAAAHMGGGLHVRCAASNGTIESAF